MPVFRHQLSRPQQKSFDRSNLVGSLRVPNPVRARNWSGQIRESLAAANQEKTLRLAQAFSDELCRVLDAPPVFVVVGGTRPSNQRGELHGLYTPATNGRRGRIEIWMTTAKRGRVVAYKTFLRTLLHELCHHFDYHLLALDDSLHTEGFFKRESSLVHQLFVPDDKQPRVESIQVLTR